MKSLSLLVALLLSISPSWGDEDFPGIKSLMTEKEFEQSGLNKQSATELEALNRWLIKYTAQDAATLKNLSESVKEADKQEIKSRILGTFVGWKGGTVFKLENGQVWVQRDRKRWKTQLEDPEITIRRNFLGFYEMRLLHKRKMVGVRRIK